jgi:hypothetical protein
MSDRFLICFAFTVVAISALSQAPEQRPILSDQALSDDQLAIYRLILAGWMENGKHPVHLAIQTLPLDPTEGADCAPSLKLEPSAANLVHRFREQDLPRLGLPTVALVDPEQQSQEITKNDPHTGIRKGASIADAVSNGFAHGMVSLGEIRFDRDHTHAIVWYGFTCGSLCGNGGTELLEKKDGKWGIKAQCGHWIS